MTKPSKDQMPKYRSHKDVRALKISSTSIDDRTGTLQIRFEEEGHPPITPPAKWRERFGGSESDFGYYVVYEDGFTSWSPSKAFEEGYTLVAEIEECGPGGQDAFELIAGDRYGRFTVHRAILRASDRSNRAALFAGVVVLHTDANMMTDELTYWAEHADFAERKEGEAIPVYEAVLTRHDDGSVTREWNRHDR